MKINFLRTLFHATLCFSLNGVAVCSPYLMPVYELMYNDCPSPMTSAEFGQLQTAIRQKSSDKDKVILAKQSIQSGCLLASQIKAIMKELSYEDSRLEVAQYAYAYCFDRQNFYQVNEAFAYTTSPEKLDKAIADSPRPVPQQHHHNRYLSAMTSAEFGQLQTAIRQKSSDKDKVILAKQSIQSGCLLASQIKAIMKELSYEDSRLEVAQYAYAYCFDRQNFYQVNEAFAYTTSPEKLDKAIADSPRPVPRPHQHQARCVSAMTSAEFGQLQTAIRQKSSDKDKVILAKQSIQSGCLLASQIKAIMKGLSYEDARLEVAQYAYPYCFDRQNFYQVNEAFAYTTSPEKLNHALGL